MFSASVHGLRNRIVRIFLRTFYDERVPLVTHYGTLIGLCEMGPEVNFCTNKKNHIIYFYRLLKN